MIISSDYNIDMIQMGVHTDYDEIIMYLIYVQFKSIHSLYTLNGWNLFVRFIIFGGIVNLHFSFLFFNKKFF